MPGEVQFIGPGTGRTCYFTIRASGGAIWSTSGGTGAFGSFLSGSWPEYAISTTEQGVNNYYVGDFPAAAPAGVFDVAAYQQAGGTAAQTDRGIAAGQVEWNGSKRVPLSDLATSGQIGLITPIRPARGVMVLNMGIYLRSAADHVTPFTSGVVSGQIARDGGSFGPLQSGAFTEIGLGWYNLQALTSGDMLANTVKLHFSAVNLSGGNADPVNLFFLLQRTSGQ